MYAPSPRAETCKFDPKRNTTLHPSLPAHNDLYNALLVTRAKEKAYNRLYNVGTSHYSYQNKERNGTKKKRCFPRDLGGCAPSDQEFHFERILTTEMARLGEEKRTWYPKKDGSLRNGVASL